MGKLPQLHASERGVQNRIRAELIGFSSTGDLSSMLYTGDTPTAEDLGYVNSSFDVAIISPVLSNDERAEFHSSDDICMISDEIVTDVEHKA